MGTSSSLAQRVAQLEQDFLSLKQRLDPESAKANPWLDKVFGAFANDQIFAQAMKLGRQSSKALDRKPHKKSASRGNPRH